MTDQYPYTQGQYLAFLYAYKTINRRNPSEGDFEKFFLKTPPTIRHHLSKLEQGGFIKRVPNTPRSIELVAPAESLPLLDPIAKTWGR